MNRHSADDRLDDLRHLCRAPFSCSFLPRVLARWIALATALGGFAISLAAFFARPTDFAHFSTIISVPWVPALGMNYHLAVDGISLTMTLVTGLTAVSAILFPGKWRSGLTNFFLATLCRRRFLRRLPQR